MPHPCDHRGFCPSLDRNPFRAGDRATAHRRRMGGHETGDPPGEHGMRIVKPQKLNHGTLEILDILFLHLLTPPGRRLLLLRVGLG